MFMMVVTSLGLAMTVRVPAPRMALDNGGAAIAIRELDVWAGSNNLIESFDWRIMPKERWSLLGPNGCGKSTLLRTIAAAAADATERGELSNTIAVNPRLRFGMLEQTAVSGSERGVKEEVMSRMAAYQKAKLALEAAQAACVSGNDCELACAQPALPSHVVAALATYGCSPRHLRLQPSPPVVAALAPCGCSPRHLRLQELLDKATSDFDNAGGYTVEKRVTLVLSGLGFEMDEFDRPCSSSSGGWQMRIGLARLLLSEPELLVMDEPTNHLDASARRWLAEYISAYSGTVLVVSHDESFVSVACNSIADVDGGRLQLYQSTPFSRYGLVREERRKAAFAKVEKMKGEEQRLLAVVAKWENVDRSKAAVALKALDKLWPEMEEAESLLVVTKMPP